MTVAFTMKTDILFSGCDSIDGVLEDYEILTELMNSERQAAKFIYTIYLKRQSKMYIVN